VERSYLIDRYPELADTFKQAGLWIWGRSQYGQLGNNANTSRSSPIQTIAAGTNWQLVSGGQYHTAAVKTDGTLWTWGRNYSGQLGTNTATDRSSPAQTIAAGTNWKDITCGRYYTAALKTDGTLWLWGSNALGQLGDNSTVIKSSPVQTISQGTNWKLVSGGFYHTAAIKTDGTLWLWGQNATGQLGDNTTTRKSSPVQTVSGGTNWKSVSSGGGHTAAIKTDGTLWTWGQNFYGQLGDNSITNRSSPAQTMSVATNWKTVFAGGNHTAAIKTDGTLWLWGYNLYGHLGDNSTANKSSPVQTVSGGTNWKRVSGGLNTTSAIKTDGTLWLWGRNYQGALGDSTITTRSSPVQTVSGGTNWKLVSGGLYHHTAIRDDSADPI
jgi:alpha-tubulin suppressor-like RCC1 family protein